MIEVKDRVPSQVLENGAIRYEEFDANGNSLGYKYIKRADEPIESGTPINKALFDSIEHDINNLPNFSITETYTEVFNSGASFEKELELNGDRFFIIKMFIDEDYVPSSYRFSKPFIGILDTKQKKFIFYYSQSKNSSNAFGLESMTSELYWQGQKASGGKYCVLNIVSYADASKKLKFKIKANGASSATISWSIEACTLSGKELGV